MGRGISANWATIPTRSRICTVSNSSSPTWPNTPCRNRAACSVSEWAMHTGCAIVIGTPGNRWISGRVKSWSRPPPFAPPDSYNFAMSTYSHRRQAPAQPRQRDARFREASRCMRLPIRRLFVSGGVSPAQENGTKENGGPLQGRQVQGGNVQESRQHGQGPHCCETENRPIGRSCAIEFSRCSIASAASRRGTRPRAGDGARRRRSAAAFS
jgi:hypothetical protein